MYSILICGAVKARPKSLEWTSSSHTTANAFLRERVRVKSPPRRIIDVRLARVCCMIILPFSLVLFFFRLFLPRQLLRSRWQFLSPFFSPVFLFNYICTAWKTHGVDCKRHCAAFAIKNFQSTNCPQWSVMSQAWVREPLLPHRTATKWSWRWRTIKKKKARTLAVQADTTTMRTGSLFICCCCFFFHHPLLRREDQIG